MVPAHEFQAKVNPRCGTRRRRDLAVHLVEHVRVDVDGRELLGQGRSCIQCVVARRPSSSPAAARANEPVQDAGDPGAPLERLLQGADELARHLRVEGRQGRHHHGVRAAQQLQAGVDPQDQRRALQTHGLVANATDLDLVRPGQQVRARHPGDLSGDPAVERRHPVQDGHGNDVGTHTAQLLARTCRRVAIKPLFGGTRLGDARLGDARPVTTTTPDTDSSRPARTERGLGPATGTALTIAGVVGTGVLVLPGLAVQDAGPAALVAVAAIIALSVPLAVTFAALGSRFPAAGGVSSFVVRALGPAAGTITAWWFYLGVLLGVPAMGLFAGDYVQAAVGGGTATRLGTALLVIAVAAAATARGIQVSGGMQVALTGLLIGGLLVVLALVAPTFQLERLTPIAPNGWGAVAPAALVLIWFLTGWEAAAHLTGRFSDARRDVPRATAVTLVVAAALSGGITLALLTVPASTPAGAHR